MIKNNNSIFVISVAAVLAIVFGLSIFLKGYGEIEYNFEKSSFTVHTTLRKDYTVAFDGIEKAELKKNVNVGRRTNGYGSEKLSVGTFKNDEFGSYSLYVYNDCDTFVMLNLKDGTVLVVGGKDSTESERIYTEILKGMEQL